MDDPRLTGRSSSWSPRRRGALVARVGRTRDERRRAATAGREGLARPVLGPPAAAACASRRRSRPVGRRGAARPKWSSATCSSARQSPLARSSGGQLGGREHLEALVRNRSPALDRKAVGAVGEPRLGALDRVQLAAEIIGQALVELVLVEVGREIRRVGVVRELAVVLLLEAGERPLDPFALGREKLTCPVVVHPVHAIASGGFVHKDGSCARLSRWHDPGGRAACRDHRLGELPA